MGRQAKEKVAPLHDGKGLPIGQKDGLPWPDTVLTVFQKNFHGAVSCTFEAILIIPRNFILVMISPNNVKNPLCLIFFH